MAVKLSSFLNGAYKHLGDEVDGLGEVCILDLVQRLYIPLFIGIRQLNFTVERQVRGKHANLQRQEKEEEYDVAHDIVEHKDDVVKLVLNCEQELESVRLTVQRDEEHGSIDGVPSGKALAVAHHVLNDATNYEAPCDDEHK